MELRERHIENRLIRQVKALEWLEYKFTAPGRRSVPDRIVIPSGHPAFWVELKAPGKEPTALQQREQFKIFRRGHHVYNADTKDRVDKIVLIESHPTSRANLWRAIMSQYDQEIDKVTDMYKEDWVWRMVMQQLDLSKPMVEEPCLWKDLL